MGGGFEWDGNLRINSDDVAEGTVHSIASSRAVVGGLIDQTHTELAVIG